MTFVFTDIEGSTQRVGEIGDAAWARLLEEHRSILRQALAAGFEVSTEGDGFFVTFTSAPEALAALIAAQRALSSHAWPDDRPLRVRMGLHTGQALVRDGDYVGQQVHRASRICDAAHGGQILLSDVTAALVRDALPAEVDLVDLGLHRLKDLGSPQRLFGVEAPGLRTDLPPPRSLEAVAHNLPVQRSAFVGRQSEIARVRTLLAGHRLVTLTGVGGAGKTRLALQVGAEELYEHADGVFFVDLAAVSDPAAVARAVADAVELRLEGDPGSGSGRLEDLLVDVLARRECLLLVDNCEHLLDACAELIDLVLAACARVRVLATSREPLGLEGEQVCPVPSLPVPETDGEQLTSEAVELFVERARSADPDFELGTATATAVGEICRRLDGIPLAIEFAAARVSHLSAEQIAARLDDRFALLTGGRRRVRRQQTLQAALDWSYQLLDDAERALLRRLAVFAGSFTLERAEETCLGDGLEPSEILDLLASLVDKSLVATDPVDGGVRYRLLETVRAYAEDKLVEADEAQRYRSAHRDAYLAWLEAFSWEALYHARDVGRALVGELANLRGALEWSRAEGRRDLVARLAVRCFPLWTFHAHRAEGQQWLTWALADPDGLDALLQAQCHSTLSWTLFNEAEGVDSGMEHHATRAIELGGERLGGLLVAPLGICAQGAASRSLLTGDAELAHQARASAQRALEVADEHGHSWSWLAAWWHSNVVMLLDGIAATERLLAALLDDDADDDTPVPWATAAHGLAVCRFVQDDPAGARAAVGRAADAAAERSSDTVLIQAATALADVQLGSASTAAAHLRVALEHAHPEVLPLTLNEALLWAGAVAHELGHHDRASSLLAAAVHVGAARETAAPFVTPASYVLYQHLLPRVRQALGPDEARRCRDQGRGLTPDEALAAALEVVDLLAG